MWPSRLSALLSTARWSFGRRVVNGPRGAVVRVRASHGFVEQFAKVLRNVRSHRRMAAVTQPCRRDPFQQLGIVQDVVPRQNSTRKKSALERHVVAWLTRPRARLRIADRPTIRQIGETGCRVGWAARRIVCVSGFGPSTTSEGIGSAHEWGVGASIASHVNEERRRDRGSPSHTRPRSLPSAASRIADAAATNRRYVTAHRGRR